MKYYVYSQKRAIKSDTKTFIVTVICILAIIINSSIAKNNIIKDTLTISLNSVKEFIISIIDNIYSFTAYGNEKNILYQENKFLKSDNTALTDNLINYYKILEENTELKNYFGIKEEINNATLINATVILRNNLYNFTVNKGSRNGVEYGDIVMTENGLVGFINEVSYNTATVQTILSPLTKVAVKDISTNKMGVLNGDITLLENNTVKLLYTKSKDDFIIGDIITTSGIGGIYPENIKIGKIINICYDEYDTSMYAVVELYENIANINKVAILTSF